MVYARVKCDRGKNPNTWHTDSKLAARLYVAANDNSPLIRERKIDPPTTSAFPIIKIADVVRRLIVLPHDPTSGIHRLAYLGSCCTTQTEQERLGQLSTGNITALGVVHSMPPAAGVSVVLPLPQLGSSGAGTSKRALPFVRSRSRARTPTAPVPARPPNVFRPRYVRSFTASMNDRSAATWSATVRPWMRLWRPAL